MGPNPESPEQRRWRVLALLVPHACHKLNNALAVIHGLAELLSRRATDPRSRTQLDTIVEQSGLASQLVSRLGDFSSTMGFGSTLVDAAVVAADAEGLLGPVFQVTGGELELRIADGIHLVEVDQRYLLQVLVTLACGPHTPPAASGRVHEHGVARLRISVVGLGSRVALRVTHRQGSAEREEATRKVVAPFAVELGGRHRHRTVGGWCCHRIALPAARP
jgi:hypothetical protein